MNNLDTSWFRKLPLTNITTVKSVSGGDINLAYQVITKDEKKFFIKVQPHHNQDYFNHEISGLNAIGKIINTPTPIYHGEIDGNAYLILNWLDETWGDQTDLGYAVAKMHQHYNDKFGFTENHQTKALIKNNTWTSNWVDFYVHQRLEPEVEAAAKRGYWNKWRQEHYLQMVKQFSNFYHQHQVKPSLLHGDLWAGNFMFADNHEPYLIDPDAVYGDREFDLAMTTIFGGFDKSFYHAYSQIFPFDDQLDERLSWYRFYYLCMHLILFGESYGSAVDRILGQY
ncbi:fructosamine kinase family protein [Limosilactobacillus sp. STM2_1]|uniref:Fructosamine kinase family protein n=1 Tax=Limosilactobacillus rudii TaxID=2759755 RepID=A0A7W3UJX0_9LACO|nr:fructosamine kinase family protein [Limosilactobacillus rudii]MBB1078345.1 fructosamine kinase family protein [Limosilactobacillus rudii]MBB1096941.1 fructosamine kinase family protein [Limosilactobacillus rudii]MCD7134059.1 fructosamine kinase family protein [Limosilactobacillus rudii]